MMKFLIATITFFIGIHCFSQDDFKLKYNDDGRVEYQGVVENDSASKSELFTKAIAWIEASGGIKSVELKDEEIGKIISKGKFSTIGKSDYYVGKEYHYNFECDIILEFKDGKTRYTLQNFKKKTSPGEPGSTLEYFIDNYKPDINSKKNRERYAKMLDEIELAVQEQVWNLMDEIKKALGPQKESDW